MRTIAHTYSTYSEASNVVTALESAGIPHSDISIVSGDQAAGSAGTGTTTGMTSGDPAQGAATGAGTGATLGTVLGGGAGLLAGIGSLAIPGIGPIVAAGWLVAALTGAGVGAAAGGLVGSLTGAGVNEADAQTYSNDVSSGRTLVTARVDESQAAQVEQMMGKTSPMIGSTTGATMPSDELHHDHDLNRSGGPSDACDGNDDTGHGHARLNDPRLDNPRLDNRCRQQRHPDGWRVCQRNSAAIARSAAISRPASANKSGAAVQ